VAAACSSRKPEEITVSTPTSTPERTASAVATAAATGTDPVAACKAAAKSGDPSLYRLVDKQRALPADYVPPDLVPIPDRLDVPGFPGQRMRKAAADAMVTLLDAADAQGVQLRVRSSYRSYATQVDTFQFWVQQMGEAQARRESAEPGHSEHQMGTTADIISQSIGWELIVEFGDTAEGKWLAAHAADYGFAISYPRDGEAVTGYIYEPWHVRYLGTTCSKAWAASGMILVKFLEAVAA
jgi:D-alanyl-D-alanine carboxypeptidase